MISYAAAPGTVAYDGDAGKPSPFTAALVENLTRPGLNIVDLFIQTRGDLERLTQDRERGPQRSEEINSLTSDHELVFVQTGTDTTVVAPRNATSSPNVDQPAVIASAAPAVEARRHVMVPGLRASGIADAQVTNALNEIILAEFQKDSRFVVVGGADITALLAQEAEKQLLGCTEDSCLAEVGEALGADVLAKTSLGAVGNSYLLSINLIDVTTATPLRRVTARAGRNDDFLIEAAQKAVQRVLDDSAENGVIVVGTGVSAPPAADEDETFTLGPPPAWPFATAAGVGAAVAVGSAIASGVFYTFGVLALDVTVAHPDYAAQVAVAKDNVFTGNVLLAVAGGAAAVSAALGGGAVALLLLDDAGGDDNGQDAAGEDRAGDQHRDDDTRGAPKAASTAFPQQDARVSSTSHLAKDLPSPRWH